MKSTSVTISLKAMNSTFLAVVLFIMLQKVVLTFKSKDEIHKYDIPLKATEQYFRMVLFIF